ncbi:MAG: PrsW family intramembrane metalloprotease [Puniceicoccaceae bacterium]
MAVADPAALWALLLIPCFFWGGYHYYKDRHQPEPIGMLVLAVVLGFISAYIGIIFYILLANAGVDHDPFGLAETSISGLFWYTVLVIGPVEEFAKFIPFALILTRMKHFDEEVDGIIYAAFVGLGFALNENIYYLSMLEGGQAVARSLISPIIHALFASIWGYTYGFAGRYKLPAPVVILLGLLLSSFVHGVYDFYVFAVSVYGSLAAPLIVLIIWIWRMRFLRDHHKKLSEK